MVKQTLQNFKQKAPKIEFVITKNLFYSSKDEFETQLKVS